jgi:hypothetical protein
MPTSCTARIGQTVWLTTGASWFRVSCDPPFWPVIGPEYVETFAFRTVFGPCIVRWLALCETVVLTVPGHTVYGSSHRKNRAIHGALNPSLQFLDDHRSCVYKGNHLPRFQEILSNIKRTLSTMHCFHIYTSYSKLLTIIYIYNVNRITAHCF